MSSIEVLLNEQYEAAEAFANAQNRLFNTTMKHTISSPKESGAEQATMVVAHLESCRLRVRTNLKELQQTDELTMRYDDHIDLSKRVIQTIARTPSWSSNGIAIQASGILERNTVALASLKASIARINEVESTS